MTEPTPIRMVPEAKLREAEERYIAMARIAKKVIEIGRDVEAANARDIAAFSKCKQLFEMAASVPGKSNAQLRGDAYAAVRAVVTELAACSMPPIPWPEITIPTDPAATTEDDVSYG